MCPRVKRLSLNPTCCFRHLAISATIDRVHYRTCSTIGLPRRERTQLARLAEVQTPWEHPGLSTWARGGQPAAWGKCHDQNSRSLWATMAAAGAGRQQYFEEKHIPTHRHDLFKRTAQSCCRRATRHSSAVPSYVVHLKLALPAYRNLSGCSLDS